MEDTRDHPVAVAVQEAIATLEGWGLTAKEWNHELDAIEDALEESTAVDLKEARLRLSEAIGQTVALYTNAPPSYEYGGIEAGFLEGCRVVDLPVKLLEMQIERARSGLYWATIDIEKAAELRTSFPIKDGDRHSK